jgi:hypothetical protein
MLCQLPERSQEIETRLLESSLILTQIRNIFCYVYDEVYNDMDSYIDWLEDPYDYTDVCGNAFKKCCELLKYDPKEVIQIINKTDPEACQLKEDEFNGAGCWIHRNTKRMSIDF